MQKAFIIPSENRKYESKIIYFSNYIYEFFILKV